MFKRVRIGDVKAEDHTLRLSVEIDSQVPEPILASRVPYLHLHVCFTVCTIWREVPRDVFKADRGHVGIREDSLFVRLEQ